MWEPSAQRQHRELRKANNMYQEKEGLRTRTKPQEHCHLKAGRGGGRVAEKKQPEK